MKKKSVILLFLCSIPVLISADPFAVNDSIQVSVFDQAKNWISGLYDYNEQEKRQAFKQLVALEQEVQEKKDAYEKAIKTASDDEKIELNNIFDQDMRDVSQRIIEQKRIVGVAVSPQARFFWNVMTGLGKLALGGLVIYKVLGDSPQNIYSEKNYYNIKNVKKTDKNALDTLTRLSQQSNDLHREALQQLSQQKSDSNVSVVSPPKNKVNVIVNNNIQSPSTPVPSISADQIDNVTNKPSEPSGSSVQPLDLPQDQKTDDYGDVFALPQNQGIDFNKENPRDISSNPDQNKALNSQGDILHEIKQPESDKTVTIDHATKQKVALTSEQMELYRKKSTNYAIGAVASLVGLLARSSGPSALFFLPIDLALMAIAGASTRAAIKSYEKSQPN